MVEEVTQVGPGQHQCFRPQAGVTLHLLHGGPVYQAFLIEVAAQTRYASHPHEGEELRYVLNGTVTFEVAGREYPVPAGGTLRHPSAQPHGFRTEVGAATFITFALSRNYDVAKLFRGHAGGAEHGL